PAWFQPAEATVTLALLEPYLDGTIDMGSFRLVNMFNMSPKAVEYGIILPLLAFVITAIYSAKRVHWDMVRAGIRPVVLSISRIGIALTETLSGILFGGIVGNVFDRWFSGGMVRDMLAYMVTQPRDNSLTLSAFNFADIADYGFYRAAIYIAMATTGIYVILIPLFLAVRKKYYGEAARPVDNNDRSRSVNIGSAEHIIISATTAGEPEESIGSLFSKVDRVLVSYGEKYPIVIKQTIFLKDAGDRAACEEYLKNRYGRDPPVTTYLYQPSADGARFAVEVMAMSGVNLEKLTGNIAVLEHDNLKWIYLGGIEPDESASNTYERGLGVLWQVKSLLKDGGLYLKDVVRFWNYVSHITDKDASGRQEYQKFNDARGHVFKPEGLKPVRFGEGSADPAAGNKIFYPSATGIGMNAGSLAMECIAVAGKPGHLRIRPLENPKQVDAHRYADKNSAVLEKGVSDTKKTSPMFSRGMAVILRKIGSKIIYVSGTASIERALSRHEGNVRAQTRLSIKNISRVLHQGKAGLEDVVSLRVYIKNSDDYEAVKDIVERHFTHLPVVTYVEADVCRENLLVEIEAMAHCRYGVIERIIDDLKGAFLRAINYARETRGLARSNRGGRWPWLQKRLYDRTELFLKRYLPEVPARFASQALLPAMLESGLFVCGGAALLNSLVGGLFVSYAPPPLIWFMVLSFLWYRFHGHTYNLKSAIPRIYIYLSGLIVYSVLSIFMVSGEPAFQVTLALALILVHADVDRHHYPVKVPIKKGEVPVFSGFEYYFQAAGYKPGKIAISGVENRERFVADFERFLEYIDPEFYSRFRKSLVRDFLSAGEGGLFRTRKQDDWHEVAANVHYQLSLMASGLHRPRMELNVPGADTVDAQILWKYAELFFKAVKSGKPVVNVTALEATDRATPATQQPAKIFTKLLTSISKRFIEWWKSLVPPPGIITPGSDMFELAAMSINRFFSAIWLVLPSIRRSFSQLESQKNIKDELSVALSLGLDERPTRNGLLNARYVGHDMAVRKIVNPRHDHKVAIYGCAGADWSNFTLSTDSDEAYFVDRNIIRAEKLQMLMNRYWYDLGEEGRGFLPYEDKERLSEYLRYKYRCGYYYSKGA
nr:Rid family hydrolase [Candidatus Omnitrophota bacterium]